MQEENRVCSFCLNYVYDPYEVYKANSDKVGTSICKRCMERNYLTCEECNEVGKRDNFTKSNIYNVDTGTFEVKTICKFCVAETFTKCGYCTKISKGEKVHTGWGDVCKACSMTFFEECDRCHGLCEKRFIDYLSPSDQTILKFKKLCNNCMEMYFKFRNSSPKKNETLISKRKIGERIKSTRKFGVELELMGKNSIELSKMVGGFHACIGTVGDGSISGRYGHGCEIVTPPLAGFNGEAALKDMITSVRNTSTRVDDSCGLHIHYDCSDFGDSAQEKFENLRDIAASYLILEGLIQWMLPKSRRDNRFCKNLKDRLDLASLFKTENDSYDRFMKQYYQASLNDCESRASNKYDNARYSGVNFHSYYHRGTIEIRWHQSTRDYEAITNWIAFHHHILDRIVKGDKISGETFRLLKNLPAFAMTPMAIKKHIMSLSEVFHFPDNIVEYMLESINKYKKNI